MDDGISTLFVSCTCIVALSVDALCVDDGGYLDDGRELFDEDLASDQDDDGEEAIKKVKDEKQPRKKKKHVDKNSIRSMLLKTKPKDEVS